MPCSRTQHGLTRVGLEPPTSGFDNVIIYKSLPIDRGYLDSSNVLDRNQCSLFLAKNNVESIDCFRFFFSSERSIDLYFRAGSISG